MIIRYYRSTLVCDSCLKRLDFAEGKTAGEHSLAAGRRVSKRVGWSVSKGKDRCANCTRQGANDAAITKKRKSADLKAKRGANASSSRRREV